MISMESQQNNKVQIKKQGLIDDGVYGYEMFFGPSWIRFGRDMATNTFIVYMIGTSIQERGKGHAKRLLDVFFKMIYRANGAVKVDSYTAAGEIWIRHVIERLAQMYGIRMVK